MKSNKNKKNKVQEFEVLESPQLPEFEELEKVSSEIAPSIEGAWWITLQLVDHIFNSISTKDKITNNVLMGLVSDYLENYNKQIDEDSIRPIPNDTIQQMIDYSEEAIKNIITSPRDKIVKEDKMIAVYKASNMGHKTMNWIAKQPGRDVKEKLAGKNKVLSQCKSFSYNTKENQVVNTFLKEMDKFIYNRIEYGVGNIAYDIGIDDGERYDALVIFQELIYKSRKSKLVEATHEYVNQPNNILINDKNYSKVWRAYKTLLEFKNNVELKWGYAIERFNSALFIALCARLCRFKGIYLYDDVTTLLDCEEKIKIRNLEKYNSEKYSFEFIINNKLDGVNLVSNLTLTLYKDELIVEICKNKYDNTKSSYNEESTKVNTYKVERNYESNVEFKRGIPINFISSDNELKTSISDFADIKGINSCINIILNQIEKDLGKMKVEERDLEDDKKSDFISLDFSSYNPKLMNSENNIIQFNKRINSLIIDNVGESEYYLPRKNAMYNINSKVISMNDMVISSDLHLGDKRIVFNKCLEYIRNNVKVSDDGYVIYTVPDSIDEFSQKTMKSIINLNFSNTYPVWRSIAAANYWFNKGKNKIRLNENDSILVIDTNEENSNAVLLKVKYNKKLNDFIFEHYAPYGIDDEENPTNYKNFVETYLNKFNEKYELNLTDRNKEYLIKSGLVSEVINNKTSIEQLMDSENIIKISFDNNIYEELYLKLIQNYDSYINKLQKEESIKNIKYFILTGEHIKYDPKLEEPIKRFISFRGLSILSNDNVIEGAGYFNNNIVNKLPTWNEYLPNLSLEVIKDGHYSKLELIKNESIENIMGIEKVIEVPEILTLEKGHKSYRFPLIKEVNKNSLDFNAILKNKAFPLKEDIQVRLSINYKYGDENSYELIVTPINTDEFSKIIAEWEEELEFKKENKYPAIPISSLSDEEVIITINSLNKIFDRLNYLFEIDFKNNRFDKDNIEKLSKQVYWATFRVQELVITDGEVVIDFMRGFYQNPLLKYIVMFIEVIKSPYNFEEIDQEALRSIGMLKENLTVFMCSLGKFTADKVINFVTDHDLNYKSAIIGSALFKNSDNHQLQETVLLQLKNNKQQMLKAFSKSIWVDQDVIINIYKYSPSCISEILIEIEKEFLRLYRFRNLDAKRITNTFRDYSKLLLAIIRLRQFDNFNLLDAGSKRANRLAKCIRTIDEEIFRSGMEYESYIEFDLSKPNALKNMNDLAYALNVYLTGDKNANLISIKKISIDKI